MAYLVQPEERAVSEPIYGIPEIAGLLGVTPAAVSNWRLRHADTVPTPDYEYLGSKPFWNMSGMRNWLAWYQSRVDAHGDSSRMTAIEELRKNLLD